MEITELFLGSGEELNSLQMSVRAILVFFIALIMLRIAGVRTFGKKSAFDNVITIMLGAVLSRVITGSSPVIPIICASFLLVLIHRLLGYLSFKNHFIGKLVKGDKKILYQDKTPQTINMQRVQISEEDIREEVRLQLNKEHLGGIKEIYIERNGEVSIVNEEEK